MSGQAAGMSVEEAKKCLKSIEATGSHASTHGGKSKREGGMKNTSLHSTPSHQSGK